MSGALTASNVERKRSPDSAKVVNASKEPPPEGLKATWKRRKVLLSFWLTVLLFGVPFWWKTTTVYRASLPYSAMDRWAEGKVIFFVRTKDSAKTNRPATILCLCELL